LGDVYYRIFFGLLEHSIEHNILRSFIKKKDAEESEEGSNHGEFLKELEQIGIVSPTGT
jgi:hypothetical protein